MFLVPFWCFLNIFWTALHRATLWGHVEIMRLLCEKNINLNAIDENNVLAFGDWTPLHVAVKWNRLQAVELLLSLGANVTIKVFFNAYNVRFELTGCFFRYFIGVWFVLSNIHFIWRNSTSCRRSQTCFGRRKANRRSKQLLQILTKLLPDTYVYR
jgi:ankyrin repeat protein